MKHRNVALADYARRRFSLAGSAMADQFPYCRPMQELGVTRAGQPAECVSFAHYDYLGLEGDPRIRDAMHAAIDRYGVGAGASRLVGGEQTIHRDLERELAEFIGVEDTLALVSGYGTNVSLVGHILTRGDLIVIDEASHNSIMTGAQASRATIMTFRHSDLAHLAEVLSTHRSASSRALVIIEGLYSMDGDIPDLPRCIEICRKHQAWLMVDEAHSIGVLGQGGRGLAEHHGLPSSEIDLIVGTLSKAFGTCGGFIAARRDVTDWLRFTLPGFVYSVGMPPPNAAAARTALSILKSESERLQRLRSNSSYFLRGAQQRGLDVGQAAGAAVIPILFPDAQTALEAAHAALAGGYFVPPIVQIAVPRDAPRLRFFIRASHTHAQIDGVLDLLATFGMTHDYPASSPAEAAPARSEARLGR